jgi:hypothetical protein
VWSRNLENEEAKDRYWAVENTTAMGCNARKTNKTVLYHKVYISFHVLICYLFIGYNLIRKWPVGQALLLSCSERGN